AGFNFLLWGGIHGAGMVIYNVWSRFSKYRIHFPVIFSRLLTFHYVCLAWIFFRTRNIEDAHIMLRKILNCNISDITPEQLIVIFMFVSVVIIYPWIVDVTRRLGEIVMSIKWYAFPVMLVPLLTVTFYFSPSGMPEFIYAAF
ncbi:MBOAT family protein, partial [Escherichia coli]|nr:MBOAT family protein [Escherichia coli]